MVAAPVALQRDVVERLEAAHGSGGAAYDGWIGFTAAHQGKAAAHPSHRAATTYDRLLTPHHLL